MADTRLTIFAHDDLSHHALRMIDDAREQIKADNASALSAARKLIAVAAGHATPMFNLAELRGLSFVYGYVQPPESRSTIESYAARAYQNAVVEQNALAEMSSTQAPLMRNNVEPAMQKAIAHALAYFEESDHDDRVQEDNDPTASATMSDHAPTVGGFEQKPVDQQARERSGDESDGGSDLNRGTIRPGASTNEAGSGPPQDAGALSTGDARLP